MPFKCIYNFKWNVWLLYLFNCLYVTDQPRWDWDYRLDFTTPQSMIFSWICVIYRALESLFCEMVNCCWTNHYKARHNDKGHYKLPEHTVCGLPTLNQCHLSNVWTFLPEHVTRKRLFQIKVISEHWGPSDPLPKTAT